MTTQPKTANQNDVATPRELAGAFGAGGLYAAMIGGFVIVAAVAAKSGAEVAIPILQAELVRIHDGGTRDVEKPARSLIASLGAERR